MRIVVQRSGYEDSGVEEEKWEARFFFTIDLFANSIMIHRRIRLKANQGKPLYDDNLYNVHLCSLMSNQGICGMTFVYMLLYVLVRIYMCVRAHVCECACTCAYVRFNCVLHMYAHMCACVCWRVRDWLIEQSPHIKPYTQACPNACISIFDTNTHCSKPIYGRLICPFIC